MKNKNTKVILAPDWNNYVFCRPNASWSKQGRLWTVCKNCFVFFSEKYHAAKIVLFFPENFPTTKMHFFFSEKKSQARRSVCVFAKTGRASKKGQKTGMRALSVPWARVAKTGVP
jgi:hypothetical protein